MTNRFLQYLEDHQGKHLVIMICFKDINSASFEGAYNAVYELISTLYDSYAYLLKSDEITEVQITKLNNVLSEKANQQELESSLELLSQCLYQRHGQRVYILIDEYDTPLYKALKNDNEVYLEAMVEFYE